MTTVSPWGDFEQFWSRMSSWSDGVFGTPEQRGPIGPAKHMLLELLVEIFHVPRQDADTMLALAERWYETKGKPAVDPKEVVDLQFFVVEIARRIPVTCAEFKEGMFEKLVTNEHRNWPKFDPANAEKAVEHVRHEKELDDGQPFCEPDTGDDAFA